MSTANQLTARPPSACWLAMAIAYFSSVACWAQGTARFTSLGDLPGGRFASYANGVSADGNVVVGFSFTASGYEAFRWSQSTGMVSLGGPNTNASAASADGSVIVGFHKNGFEAMRWTAQTGIVGLGYLLPEIGFSQAQGVSDDGAVVVGYSSGGGAFRWTAETEMIGIGGSVACCISADGSVIAGSIEGNEAFRWTVETGIVGLGDLPGGSFDSVSRAISADGRVIVGTSRSGKTPLVNEAFRWSEEMGMVGLGALQQDTTESTAEGVSSDGRIIVGYDSAGLSLRTDAFIWDETNGMRNLQELLVGHYGLADALSGWKLERAYAITPDGLTIVGYGRNPQGSEEAWRVQFVPEPHAATLMLVAIAASSTSRRYRSNT